MKIRIVQCAALLSIVGFAAWLSSQERRGSAAEQSSTSVAGPVVVQEASEGSAVQCAVPTGWRIARVDEEFRLSEREATEAFRRAAALWGGAVGRRLFAIDAAGFPIRFVYDERQASTQERSRLRSEFEAAGARLQSRRAELSEMKTRYSRMLERYEIRLRELRQRGSDHADTVRVRNQHGGAPEDVAERLRSTERALEEELRELRAEEDELRALENLLEGEAKRFNQEINAHNRRGAAIEAEFPTGSIESGRYREVVRTEDGRIRSVQREIRIYRFTDTADLVRVIAHELGHALGLGHASDPTALMHAEFDRSAGPSDGARLERSDVELLRSRCPAL